MHLKTAAGHKKQEERKIPPFSDTFPDICCSLAVKDIPKKLKGTSFPGILLKSLNRCMLGSSTHGQPWGRKYSKS